MLPIGVLIDCGCVLFGTNLGSAISTHVPEKIKQPMNVIFGIAAIAIGIVSIIKLNSLPAVILALILGALIGELIDLDGKVKTAVKKYLQSSISKFKGIKTRICVFICWLQ